LNDRHEHRCPGIGLGEAVDRALDGLATFPVDGVPAAHVVARLRGRAVNTIVATAGSARFDLPHRGRAEVARTSMHYYNNDQGPERLPSALPLAS